MISNDGWNQLKKANLSQKEFINFDKKDVLNTTESDYLYLLFLSNMIERIEKEVELNFLHINLKETKEEYIFNLYETLVEMLKAKTEVLVSIDDNNEIDVRRGQLILIQSKSLEKAIHFIQNNNLFKKIF